MGFLQFQVKLIFVFLQRLNFLFIVKVKLTVPLLCVCMHSAWKGHPWNDLYCVRWDVKPYSLTHYRSIHCHHAFLAVGFKPCCVPTMDNFCLLQLLECHFWALPIVWR